MSADAWIRKAGEGGKRLGQISSNGVEAVAIVTHGRMGTGPTRLDAVGDGKANEAYRSRIVKHDGIDSIAMVAQPVADHGSSDKNAIPFAQES